MYRVFQIVCESRFQHEIFKFGENYLCETTETLFESCIGIGNQD